MRLVNKKCMVKTPPSPPMVFYTNDLQMIMEFGRKNLAKFLPFFSKSYWIWRRKKKCLIIHLHLYQQN